VREYFATAWAQEAVGADFREPLREDMLEEAVDERFSRERQTMPPGAAALLDAERDVPIFERFQAVVGEGNPVDRGGEGCKDRGAGPCRLTGGHPILVPGLGRHRLAEASGGQRRFARAPEEPGARADRHEPGRTAGGEPLRTVWRQGPPRDKRVDRRMGGKVPGPGVEDAHHADLPTEGVGVQRQGLSGGSGGLKKQVGHEVLV
jgi:hypothetical protein